MIALNRSNWSALAASLVLLLLSGCAAQKALEQGEQLLVEGRAEEGLAKLREAVRLEPTTAQYRLSYLRNRDLVLQGLIDRAESLMLKNDSKAAELAFREALGVLPGYEGAVRGLRNIDSRRRWDALIAEAESLLARKDYEGAREKVRQVLVEAPRHERARELALGIERAAERPAAEATLAAYYRKPVSIEFRDTSLRTVFDILSRTSGLNFVFDKDIRGDQKTSIHLRNSTVEAAINLLLSTNQLEQRVIDGSTLLIYPTSTAKLREYQALTVRSFYLSHAEAKVVAGTIKAIAKSRDVVVDDKLNMLIVRDSPSAIRIIEKLVALHDVPEPEVMLDVEILEVKRTKLLNLGVRLPDQLTLSPLATGAGGALTVQDLRNLDSSSIGASVGAVTLNAKKQDTDANLLANPRIRSRNREKAKILIGERVPNITTTLTSTGFATDSVTYVDVGLKLDVEPINYPDGEVTIRVALEVSNIISQVVTKSGSAAYQIGTRGAQTVLRLADGENQVLAGLISDEDRRSGYKLPGAGDIPILGRLFGSQTDDSSKTEIVLSITPRIIRNIPRPSAGLAEFDSGTEASIGARAIPASNATGTPAAKPAAVPQRQGPSNQEAASATVPGPAANGIELSWAAPRQIGVGDTVNVQLLIRAEPAIADISARLDYDPAVLQLVAANEGDFLRQGGSPSQFRSRPEPPGQVGLALSKAGGARGGGMLAAFVFRALAPTSGTTISLSGLEAVGADATRALPQAPAALSIAVTP